MTPRIIGLLVSGYAVRMYAAGFALYVVVKASEFVHYAFSTIGSGLPQ